MNLDDILCDWFSTVSDGQRYYPNSTYVKEAKAQIEALIADKMIEYQQSLLDDYKRDIKQAIIDELVTVRYSTDNGSLAENIIDRRLAELENQ